MKNRPLAYKVTKCGNCPLGQDTMHELYCGPLMQESVDDDHFTVDAWGIPPERCPIRKGTIKIKLAKGIR